MDVVASVSTELGREGEKRPFKITCAHAERKWEGEVTTVVSWRKPDKNLYTWQVDIKW